MDIVKFMGIEAPCSMIEQKSILYVLTVKGAFLLALASLATTLCFNTNRDNAHADGGRFLSHPPRGFLRFREGNSLEGNDLESSYMVPKSGLRSLAYAATQVTTKCNSFRPVEDYPAELQLNYVYLVEFEKGGSRSLTFLQDAIAFAISDALDTCDNLDRPMYKVKTDTRHEFSKDEFCPPMVDGNACSVVNGATAILLDSQSAQVQEWAYMSIDVALQDTSFVQDFARSVVRAEFVRAHPQSLIVSTTLGNDESNSTGATAATVAAAAASVSFVVATIFCYGLMRRELRRHPDPSIRHKNNTSRCRKIHYAGRTFLQNSIRGLHKRRNFVRFEELAISRGGTHHDSPIAAAAAMAPIGSNPIIITNPYSPSITWSISDISSDSASLYSGVSWSTSKLARIDEEDEEREEEYDYVCDRDEVPTQIYSSDQESEQNRCHAGFSVQDLHPISCITVQSDSRRWRATSNTASGSTLNNEMMAVDNKLDEAELSYSNDYVGSKNKIQAVARNTEPTMTAVVDATNVLGCCMKVEEIEYTVPPILRSVTPDDEAEGSLTLNCISGVEGESSLEISTCASDDEILSENLDGVGELDLSASLRGSLDEDDSLESNLKLRETTGTA